MTGRAGVYTEPTSLPKKHRPAGGSPANPSSSAGPWQPVAVCHTHALCSGAGTARQQQHREPPVRRGCPCSDSSHAAVPAEPRARHSSEQVMEGWGAPFNVPSSAVTPSSGAELSHSPHPPRRRGPGTAAPQPAATAPSPGCCERRGSAGLAHPFCWDMAYPLQGHWAEFPEGLG